MYIMHELHACREFIPKASQSPSISVCF